MVDTSQMSSNLDNSTPSTIYELPIVDKSTNSNEMNGSLSSVSSAGSSIVITDSLTGMEDFPGFAAGDPELADNVLDPFQGIFYHMMPLHDSTNIMFYNQANFNNIMIVLSKQFSFPTEGTKKFQLKTHVEQKKCILSIDKDIMSLCASGPGHMAWKDKEFRNLGENLFRTFIRNNESLLSKNSTQNQEDNGAVINETMEPETEPPAGAAPQQPGQVTDFTHLQDSPVIIQISALIDMISTLQGQINTLTRQVNGLVSRLLTSLCTEQLIRLLQVLQL